MSIWKRHGPRVSRLSARRHPSEVCYGRPMATVLVFGSRREPLGYVVQQLERAGYRALPALACDETLRWIETEHVDVLVLDGSGARRWTDDVVGALKRRQPWAKIFLPGHTDEVLPGIERHFSHDPS